MKRTLLLLSLSAATAFTSSAALTITTTSLPNVIVGQPYPVITLQTSGAFVGVNWSVSAGTLPSGFVVGPAQPGQPATNGTFCIGTFSTAGPPSCSNTTVQSAPGSYTFTLQAIDSQEQLANQQFTIVVGSPIQITTQSLPNGFMGQPYSFTLQTSGGTGPAVWAVVGNPALRSDFTLDSGTGIISSPSAGAVGSFSFTVLASDPTGPSTSASFTLTVTLPLKILQTTLPPTLQGTLYQTTLSGSGGVPPYQWSLGASMTGFSIQGSGSTATITGSAQGMGNVSLPVILTDSSGAFLEETFTIQVVTQLIITSSPPPPAEIGFAYSQQTTVSGGLAPYTFSISAGALPQGLGLNSSTGLIQGTPTAGSSQFTLRVSDSSGQVAAPTYTINVIAGITIVTTSLPFGNTGSTYSQTLVSTGGMAPISWTILNPPPGLTLSSTGVLTGTPTVLGPQTFTVGATDLVGHTAQRSLILTVLGGSGGLSIFGATSFTATVGTAFSQRLVPSGGTPTYSWTVIDPTVPPGLGLTTGGIIQGTPTAVGQFSFVVQLSDSEGLTATAQISINVLAVLSITTTSLPAGEVGAAYSQAVASTGGVTPLSWSVVTGNPPAGIQLNTATGILAGTPTATGSQTFTVQVTDAAGRTAQQQLTLSIVPVLTITSSGSFTGSVAAAFSSTLGATGGVLPYSWSVSSGALPGALQLNAGTGAITGTPTASGTTNVDLKVTDSGGQTATLHAIFTINLAQTPAITIGLGSTTQPAVSVTLNTPAAKDVTGTLTLSFVSSVGGTDNMIRFSNGALTLNFQIPAGTTSATFPAAPNVAVITGTVAGTITLQVTATTSDGINLPAPPQTIVENRAPPVITSVTLQQVSGGVNVVVTGYSNTREVSTGLFHFTVSSGNTLSQSDLTVPLTAAYTTWFSNALANSTGGQFTLTEPFAVGQGSATAVTGVQVTLTNQQGASVPVTSH